MRKTLFLGNGINRLYKSRVGWDEVLEDLANIVGGSQLTKFKEYIPFSLIYEGFSSESPEGSKRGETPLKTRVAEALRKMEHNEFHKRVMQLGLSHIITTNYDYCLENSSLAPIAHENLESENRYSVFRRTKVSKSYVWHVHGEINKPKTITLGHEQYAGQLQKLRSHLTSKKSSPYRAGISTFELPNRKYSWGDIFLKDEVHIVGFSLDYSEIDIWWLLIFKAQYFSRYGISCGRTFFHYWSDEEKDDKDKGKIVLLKSIKVDVKEKFNVNFREAYSEFLSGFNQMGSPR